MEVPASSPLQGSIGLGLIARQLITDGIAHGHQLDILKGIVDGTMFALQQAARSFVEAAVQLELPVDYALSKSVLPREDGHGSPHQSGQVQVTRETIRHPVWTIIWNTDPRLDSEGEPMEHIDRLRQGYRQFGTEWTTVEPDSLLSGEGNNGWSQVYKYNASRVVIDAAISPEDSPGPIRVLHLQDNSGPSADNVIELRGRKYPYPYRSGAAQPHEMFDTDCIMEAPTVSSAEEYGSAIVERWILLLDRARTDYQKRRISDPEAEFCQTPYVFLRERGPCVPGQAPSIAAQ